VSSYLFGKKILLTGQFRRPAAASHGMEGEGEAMAVAMFQFATTV
jgi:hypothetical protein